MLTVSQAKNNRKLAAATGVCTNGDVFLDYLNEGTRMLMRRGNFWGTVQMINVCVRNQCITWPRYVGTILAVNFCGRNVPVENNWYQFAPITGVITGHGFGFKDGVCSGNTVVVNDGTVSVFNNVPCGTSRYIRAYLSVRADIGKKITIFGIDSNGQVIRTKNASGIWGEGVTLTLPDPKVSSFVSTPMKVREITRVIKEETSGVLRLFQYDADTNLLHDCAIYDPSETVPDYRHSRISRFNVGCCNCSDGVKTVQGLVKLEFVEAKADTDLVLISNIDALALALQYARLSDAQKDEEAESKMARAVHELNLELRDKFPLDQTPISINPFGTALPVHHSIGRVV